MWIKLRRFGSSAEISNLWKTSLDAFYPFTLQFVRPWWLYKWTRVHCKRKDEHQWDVWWWSGDSHILQFILHACSCVCKWKPSLDDLFTYTSCRGRTPFASILTKPTLGANTKGVYSSVTPLLSTNLNLVNRPCTSTVHSKGEKLYCSLAVDETRKRNRRKTASFKGSKKMRFTCTDLNTKFAIVDDLLSQNAPHFLLRANFDTDFEIMRTNDKNVVNVEIRCDACQRFSTLFYPIILQPLPTKLICKRKYIPKFQAENVEVCSLCAIYSSTFVSPSWLSAWPCVINTLRKKIELSSKLPFQLLLSWVPHLQNDIKDCFQIFSENVFVDVTRQLIDFRLLLSTYKSADYVTAMKKIQFSICSMFLWGIRFLKRVRWRWLQSSPKLYDARFQVLQVKCERFHGVYKTWLSRHLWHGATFFTSAFHFCGRQRPSSGNVSKPWRWNQVTNDSCSPPSYMRIAVTSSWKQACSDCSFVKGSDDHESWRILKYMDNG